MVALIALINQRTTEAILYLQTLLIIDFVVIDATVYGQNGETETATGMAIFKTATNPNNTYSSASEMTYMYIVSSGALNSTHSLTPVKPIYTTIGCTHTGI